MPDGTTPPPPPRNFYPAYGPLSGDTILAFTTNGEAHWFRIRRRDGE